MTTNSRRYSDSRTGIEDVVSAFICRWTLTGLWGPSFQPGFQADWSVDARGKPRVGVVNEHVGWNSGR
jgi:hypothetical protein